ncbi:MAG: tetratricopeptide repeat protein [Lentisphaeria bacterium]|nr:tetratricopeptide repeat protein [Lentisphaeria bacterium]
MSKKKTNLKCPLCGKKKGKRECALHDGAVICSLCCVAIRNPEQCGECSHFKEAEQYRRNQARQGKPPEFIMRYDEEVENQVDLALQAIDRGRLKQGEARIRDLYQANDDLSCTQYAMGVVHLSKKEPEQAAVYFREAIATFPYFAEAHYNLSACYRQMMVLGKALRSLMEARDLAEPGGEVYTRASAMLHEFEGTIRQHEGVDSLEQYIEAAEAFERGFENMENGKFREAIVDFQESLRIQPDKHQAYGNLGICLGKLGMKDEALAMLDRALEIDPGYEPAKWNREGIEKLAEGDEDVGVASIQYNVARHLEDEEHAQGRTDAKLGSVAAFLNRLRRRG